MQILCIGDGGWRCWAGRCGGNARNRVCRLATAFGHNVQAIITYLYMVKTFYKSVKAFDEGVEAGVIFDPNITGTVGRVVSLRVECICSIVQKPTHRSVMNYFNLQITPAKLSRSAKQHPSKSAHLLRRFVRGLSIYVYQFFIPIDLRA
jgi:hypothetical protein